MPQACNRQTAYCVPLYDTLGPDAVEYIIGHAEVTIVFASALKMRALVEPLTRAKGKVKAAIVWGEIDGIAKMVSSTASLEVQATDTCWSIMKVSEAIGPLYFILSSDKRGAADMSHLSAPLVQPDLAAPVEREL